MASIHIKLFLFCSVLFIISHSTFAKTTSFRPKSLVLPVTKDPSTNQYVTEIKQRTPLVPVKLTVDLGGQDLWVDCEQRYVSSSYKPSLCNSAQCNLARSRSCTTECYDSPKPGCYNNTCNTLPDNSVARVSTSGQLGHDVVSIQSTDGSSPGSVVSAPKVLFTCGASFLLQGLANGVKGMAGLGVMFFGDAPYVLLPGIDVSKFLTYTPLILNKVSTAGSYFEGDPSTDYFIGVKSIQINGKAVPLNTSLLSIDKDGYGGTKISTVVPYMVMETTIYNAVVNAYSKTLAGVPKVSPVAPFGLCFNAKSIGSSRLGPNVPSVNLVLQNKAIWSISGANLMIQPKKDVLCLAIVDGGVDPRTSIVIGGHQLENTLLQFDLAASRLGFTFSLLFRQTTCANFNFTSRV